MKDTALIVIDVQKDFCSEEGVLAKSGRDLSAIQAAVHNLADMVEVWRTRAYPIVFTKLVYDLARLPETHRARMQNKKVEGLCQPETEGVGFFQIKPLSSELVIEKNYYSAFYNTVLENHLHSLGITTLLITGVTTHVCPLLTCADAYYRGSKIVAVKDCLGTYEGQDFSLRYIVEQFAGEIVESKELLRLLGCGNN